MNPNEQTVVSKVAFEPFDSQEATSQAPAFADFLRHEQSNPIMGVKVDIKVSLGQLTMSLGDLMKAHKGQVFPLDTKLQDPVELSVEGHIVALGLLVAVGDHFGVQVTELKKTT